MSDIPTFNGFPKQGIDFLNDLKANNNKAWFESHKQDYIDNLRTPAQALVVALGTRLQMISADIIFDPRVNGAGSLFRIYRDVRFSKDKTPYKHTVDMVFWEGQGKKMMCPGFGVRISPDGIGMYAGMRMFDKDDLTKFRNAIVDDKLGEELEAIINELDDMYGVGSEHYKRVPRGFDKEHPKANLLKYNALYAECPYLDPKIATSSDLVDTLFGHLQKMSPVEQWLVKVLS